MTHYLLNYVERMHEHGYRVTPQRRLILDAICEGGQSTLEEIQTRMQSKDPTVNISTLYRTLDFLCELRLVVAAERNDGHVVYEIASLEPHHHLICRQCGKMVQINHNEVKLFFERLEEQYGYHIDMDHLALFGLCKDCRTEE
jgi:Fur family ferric uptake transcriptional regulator